MTVYAYIAVEGPHDVAFVAELLKPQGLLRVQKKSELDPYWIRLVPQSFPYKDDLLARVPVPLFLQKAIVSGITAVLRPAKALQVSLQDNESRRRCTLGR